jgi:hypothetical protein
MRIGGFMGRARGFMIRGLADSCRNAGRISDAFERDIPWGLRDWRLSAFFLEVRAHRDTYSARAGKHLLVAPWRFPSTRLAISTPTISNSDSAFSWMAGAGADYRLNPHWTDLDLLRTHLNSGSQSRFRLGLGVAYTFGSR